MTATTRPGPVLVGVAEGSGHDALDFAAAEAARRGLPLRVLHAYSAETSYPWGYGYPLPAGVLQNVEEVARSNALSVLEDAAQRVRDEHPDLPLTTTLSRSSAAASLVLTSREASTLVVGRRAHRHRWAAALGSVSLAVAAHASCPVVVVPNATAVTDGSEGTEGSDRTGGTGTADGTVEAPASGLPLAPGGVLVGVEDSPECADAVAFAFAHAAARGLPLTAVHSWWIDPAVLALGEGIPWTELPPDDHVTIDALVAPWANRFADVPVSRVVVRDRPADALLTAAEGAALLVVGSRGRGGFTGLLLGSVSRHVLQHARCPVAVVRAGQVPTVDDLDVQVRA
jgi:nucleotide-binding universal stress UspA family protein